MSFKEIQMQSILDREINNERDDEFGHRHFSKALEYLIENPQHNPPYSIGLLGKWGSGKSSIQSMYLASLSEDSSRDAKKHLRSQKIFTINFNAWRYGGENIKRVLLRHVYISIGGDKEKLDDALFKKVQQTRLNEKKISEMGKEFYEKYIWASMQIIPIFLIMILVFYIYKRWFDISNTSVNVTFFTIIGAVTLYAVKQLPKLNKLLISRYSSLISIDEPRTAAEQYEDLLLEQLHLFKSGKGKKNGKNCERIVIFIDDLDRLAADEMIRGMDAIRTFMEIPKFELPKGIGVIFIISCDEDRVAKALDNRDHGKLNPDLPAAVFSKVDARRYLDRLFQFRLEIPGFPRLDMRNFALKLFAEKLSDVSADIKTNGTDLQNVIDRLIPFNIQSPRNVIQILNAFGQAWWLGKQREIDGSGTDRAGGLREKSVTGHPLSLAVISALRVDFPDFYSDLLIEPNLIVYFSNVFIRSQKIEKQPEESRPLLQKYQNSQNGQIRPEYRMLRQYIVSIQGLRWPDSIQPLLKLSQDSVTRGLGDKAWPIWNAFRSGDGQELVRLFGRDIDNKPLSTANVRKLKDMVERLSYESDVTKDNASACLAEIANRIPENEAHRLMSPLARRLSDSNELRWRLGVPKIEAVLKHSTPGDRKEVAARLASDLLALDGDIDFRKESGQNPSLDEASEMAKQACDVILWIREKDGLYSETDDVLLRWLKIRRVAVSGKETSFPFNELEEWVNNHEDNLLPDLKDNYTQLVVEQFEEDDLDNFSLNAVLKKCRRVFSILWDEGEESREIFWEQLTRFVNVQCPDSVTLSYELVQRRGRNEDGKLVSPFIEAFVDRQIKYMEDSELYPLDQIYAAKAFIAIVQKCGNNIEPSTIKKIVELSNQWSLSEETVRFTCEILNIQAVKNDVSIQQLVSDWINRLFKKLHETCTKWLASQIEQITNEEQKKALVSRLNQFLNPENIPDLEAKSYRGFISSMPREALDAQWFEPHLNHLFSNIGSRHQNQQNYLNNIFPVIPIVIEHGNHAKAGDMLQNLFPNLENRPELFGLLHAYMDGAWPKNEGEYGSYNPKTLFDSALGILNQHPGESNMKGILKSAASMIKNEVVDIDNEKRLVEISGKVWKYMPDAAYDVMVNSDHNPSEQHIIDMVDHFDYENESDREKIENMWKLISQRLDYEQLYFVTEKILEKGPKRSKEEPDFCFRLWLDFTGNDCIEILKDLLIHANLSDGNMKRTWLQCESRKSKLGKQFFMEIVPEILKRQEIPETTSAVFDSKNDLDELFTTKDDRYSFCLALLKSFKPAPTFEIKNKILSWIKESKCDSVLSELKSVTEEDLQILISHFRNNRKLKKLKTEKT